MPAIGPAALERRHPACDWATTGAIAGGAFTCIANAQLGRLRTGGATAPRAAGAREIRSLALRLPLAGACDTLQAGERGEVGTRRGGADGALHVWSSLSGPPVVPASSARANATIASNPGAQPSDVSTRSVGTSSRGGS